MRETTADLCRYCGAEIGEEEPYGFWVTGDGVEISSEARYCADAPDHLHWPGDETLAEIAALDAEIDREFTSADEEATS